jgi:anaerobic ribonucleoside-triphosphate reductase
MVKIIKKYKKEEDYDFIKIKTALSLASERAGKELKPHISEYVKSVVENNLVDKDKISVQELHTIVEYALREVDEDIYIEYLKYNNYKHKFPFAFNDMLQEGKRVVFNGDKENANKNSAINSTQKEILGGLVSEQIMLNYELQHKIAQAHNDNWIYIHDLRDRFLFNNNCCLYDLYNTLKGGFNLNGVDIEEADTLETAFDQVNDIIMCASSQQYGGFTIPNIDETMGHWVKKSWYRLKDELPNLSYEEIYNKIFKATKSKIKMLEYKINCVNNALGQTPFVTWTFGLGTDIYSKIVSKAILEVRTGKLGRKKDIAIFPKLVFLHKNEINGLKDSPNYDLKKLAIKCSMECMYPDFLSLDSGYLKEVYDRCKTAISPMGLIPTSPCKTLLTYSL